jgi:hypothetical protein
MNLLSLYTSRQRQCKLGYDSSAACDSFQLGEMVKFLSKKGLLFLVPFQAASPDDPDYEWPEAYSGDIDNLLALLRQCPSYQIDKNHAHCGLRTKILPIIEYIKDCIDTGVGIKAQRWNTDRPTQTWVPPKVTRSQPFTVGNRSTDEETSKTFEFSTARSGVEFGGLNVDKSAKHMFTANQWIWVSDEEGTLRLPRTTPSLKY